MSFSTIIYHEIREESSFHPEHSSQIDVKQGYEDILPSHLFVTLEQFKEHMKYLHDNHYYTLTLEEVKAYYYKKQSLPEKSVLLTFDDCYQSIKRYAYPILKEYNFHAVGFVVTSWLHTSPKPFNPDRSVTLTEKDLIEMSDIIEYANHTDSFHRRTNKTTCIIMTAPEEEFIQDIKTCSKNDILQAKDVFAYPFGLFTDRNVELVRNNGFSLAFTSKPGRNDLSLDPFLLHRTIIPYSITMEEFQEVVGK